MVLWVEQGWLEVEHFSLTERFETGITIYDGTINDRCQDGIGGDDGVCVCRTVPPGA